MLRLGYWWIIDNGVDDIEKAIASAMGRIIAVNLLDLGESNTELLRVKH
jgi:hypothetical protein